MVFGPLELGEVALELHDRVSYPPPVFDYFSCDGDFGQLSSINRTT